MDDMFHDNEPLETLDDDTGNNSDSKLPDDTGSVVPNEIPEDESLETLDDVTGTEADGELADDPGEEVPNEIPEDESLETLDDVTGTEADGELADDPGEEAPNEIPEDESLETLDDVTGAEADGEYVDGLGEEVPNEIPEDELLESGDDLTESTADRSFPEGSAEDVRKDILGFPRSETLGDVPEITRQDIPEKTIYPTMFLADNNNANNALPEDSCATSRFAMRDIPQLSGLDGSFISDIPEDKRNAVDMAYKDAPQEIVSEINDRLYDLNPVADTGYSINENGQPVKDGCYYSPNDHQVRMDETLDPDEYAEVLPHEMTHFLDHSRGWESHSPEFSDAFASDIAKMDRNTPEGRMLFHEMLDDAFNTGAAYDRNISDIIHAAFRNDPDILSRYNDEGAAGSEYSHWNNYWDRPFAREEETYANCGAVTCADSLIGNHFLERYYPNTISQFKHFYNIK